MPQDLDLDYRVLHRWELEDMSQDTNPEVLKERLVNTEMVDEDDEDKKHHTKSSTGKGTLELL